jgi:hypothetical protein
MHNHHNREVQIEKSKLIAKIKENRDSHQKDWEEAVEAYRKEATKQLRELGKKLKDGKTDLQLNLVTPVNRVEDYNKVIEMFEWDVNEVVSLTQREFNEYVHDETQSAVHARMMNASYKG